MRTAQQIEQHNAERESADKPKAKRKMNPKSLANLVAPWTDPEGSNPPPKSLGRPKDVAAQISRAAFENNRQEIYMAVVKELLKGSPYAFVTHSDRAYGKLKQGFVHTGDEEGGPINACIRIEFVKPSE